jgi:hypothetical protein
MSTSGGVTAVVVAARGGERLAATLDTVAWAAERLVLDPAGRVGSVPAGTRRSTTVLLAQAVTTGWLVLLREGERAEPGMAAAVTAATGDGGGPAAYRVRHELVSLGLRLCLPEPVRVARREGARLAVGRHGGLVLRTSESRPGRLAAAVTVGAAASLAGMVTDMDADGSVVAAVLAAGTVQAGIGRTMLAALCAGVRVLGARRVPADEPMAGRWGGARWCSAALAGYAALLAHAKVWERIECGDARPT